MTSTFDSTGITLDRYADVLARLEALAIAQWGEGIDTSEDEFYGHQLRLISLLVSELNEIIQSLYDSGSVTNSSGTALGNNVELIGLSYVAAAASTVTLTLTATAATTVTAGTQYGTDANVVFETDEELVFAGAGSSDVTATCTVTGANEAAIGEVDVIINSIYGISTCTNAAAATPGRDQETPAELKARHTIAVATSGEEDSASIYEAITNVSGVSAAYIYDNDTDETVGGVPAHNIHCSAIGGTDAAVAAAIATAKTSGVPTHGGTTETVYNSTTRQSKDINFDRAVNTDNYIIVNIVAIDGVFPDDGAAQIKAAIVAHYEGITINDSVIFTALYAPVYSIAGLTVTSMFLDTTPAPAATADLSSSSLIRYVIETANITVNVA